jgi:hypothetical protein
LMTSDAPSVQSDRQRLVLDTMRRLNRPIWLGDLNPRPSERAAYAVAFRQLLEAKIIKRASSSGRSRIGWDIPLARRKRNIMFFSR